MDSQAIHKSWKDIRSSFPAASWLGGGKLEDESYPLDEFIYDLQKPAGWAPF